MYSSEATHTMQYRDNAHNTSGEGKNLSFTGIVTPTDYLDNDFG